VKPYPDATFGLEYAFGRGFSRVDLNGNTYRQPSPGVVFLSKQIAPLPRYIVVMDQRSTAWVPKLIRTFLSSHSLQLIDRASGDQLAIFTLPRQGWPGDQAGKWLAGLLNPDPRGERDERNNIFNASMFATVEAISPESVLQIDDPLIRGYSVKSCPKSVFVHYDKNSDHGQSELKTPNWTLLMPHRFREVYCLRGMVMIFGESTGQEHLELIAIDLNGNLVGRASVFNDKVDLGDQNHITKIISLEESGENLIIRKAHFSPQSPPDQLTVAFFEERFRIPWSAVAMPR
jgi:hypothetical protein